MIRNNLRASARPFAAALLAAALLAATALPAAAAPAAGGEHLLARMWDALVAVFAGAGPETDPNGNEGDAGGSMDPNGYTIVPTNDADPDMDPNGIATTTDDGEAGPSMDPNG